MTTNECVPSTASVVYAPQWILNTIQVQPGDKVCVHSIKDLYKRVKSLRVQAVLVTPSAIKDILFTGQDTSSPNLISEKKLKQLVVKGLWRYSYLNLGQYVKVELEPPAPSFGSTSPNNSRPVILRIVSIYHNGSQDSSNPEVPFSIGDTFTKFDIHLNHSTIENPLALPDIEMNPLVTELLDFREREMHIQYLEAVHLGNGHGMQKLLK